MGAQNGERLHPSCRTELEVALDRLARGVGDMYNISSYGANNIANVRVSTVVEVLDLHARVIFPATSHPNVRRIKWRDVQHEGTRRGTLYVLTRRNDAPMFFAISRTEVRRVLAKML